MIYVEKILCPDLILLISCLIYLTNLAIKTIIVVLFNLVCILVSISILVTYLIEMILLWSVIAMILEIMRPASSIVERSVVFGSSILLYLIMRLILSVINYVLQLVIHHLS